MWKNRRVLVTGATGLLGSHMVKALDEKGADIIAIVRDLSLNSNYYAHPAEHVAYGDVEDYAFVNRVVNEYQVQTIFHLAAQTQVGVANRNPLPTLRTNILGTVNVLEAARINGTEQVVVASSDKAYGRARSLPYNEDTPLRGEHPYDVSKSCADLIAQSYRKTFGMKVAVTRCGNLFGPGDLNYNRLIPGTIRSLLARERPVIRSDGTMTRDYFYVKDAVVAYLTLAEHIEKYTTHVFEYNFSYGTPYSVLEMVDLIQLVMSTNLPPTVLGQATNEIQEQYLDSHSARMLLDWTPLWSIDDALRETVAWYKEVL